MTKIDDETRLRHMLDAAREASLFIQGKTRESLNTERMLALSLVRLLEIINDEVRQLEIEPCSKLQLAHHLLDFVSPIGE